jgi:hypothetical protein
MIRQLLKRDQGTDNLLGPALAGLAVAVMIRAISQGEQAGDMFNPDSRGFIWFGHNIIAWSVLLAGMIGSHYWLRAPRLHMALPISARMLWGARMTAVCIGCGVILLMITLVNGISYEAGRGLRVIPSAWLGMLRIVSIFLLMLMLLQSPAPNRRKLETTPWYVAYTVILWVFGLLLLLLGPRGLWLTGPALVAAALVGHRIWRHLPGAFLLENTESDGTVLDDPLAPGPTEIIETPRSARTPVVLPRNGSSTTLMHATLFRLMHNHWLGWIFIIALTLYGGVLTIHYYRGGDPFLALLYFFMFIYGGWNQAILRIHPVDAWPISRRLIFAHAMLPLMIPYLLGMGLGALIQETKARPSLMVLYEDGVVDVPYEFRAIAPDGVPPTITTPWGETFTPEGARIVPWSDAVIYNPYAVGYDTSTRLDALQIDRAVAAVHGDAPPDPALYADLEVNGPEGATDACYGLTLEDSRGRASALRAKTFALLIVLFALFEFPLAMMGTLTYDRRALELIRSKAVVAGAFTPLIILAAVVLPTPFTDTTVWAQAAWLMITLRRFVETLPLSAAQCWLGAALVIALGYVILQERFTRLEASHALVKKERDADY